MLTTHFVDNGEITTAFLDEGLDEGRGPPLLLLHGFTGSKLDFHDQLQWFSDRQRVLAPDQRGHGETSNPGRADAYSLDILTEDLAGFLDALDVQRCHLLGHSMGGMVALRFALRYPHRLTSLILMDTAAEALSLMPRKLRDQLASKVRAEGCASRFEAIRSMPMNAAQARGRDYIGADEHWRRIKLKLTQMDPEAWIALSDEFGQQNPLLEKIAAISVPTTIIVGEHDTPFVEPSARMAQAIPNARLEIIPLASHCPQYENADAWRSAVDAHLARVN